MTKRACLVKEKGQELVEFALLLPLLLALLLGLMEFGIAVFRYNTIANVAREVARYSIVHRNDTAAIDAYIASGLEHWTIGVDPADLEVTVTFEEDPFRPLVRVVVTYQHHYITAPIIRAVGGNPNLNMQTESTMYSE